MVKNVILNKQNPLRVIYFKIITDPRQFRLIFLILLFEIFNPLAFVSYMFILIYEGFGIALYIFKQFF